MERGYLSGGVKHPAAKHAVADCCCRLPNRNEKRFRFFENYFEFVMFCFLDFLLRGCRLRRRICDPNDVILGVVDLVTSHSFTNQSGRSNCSKYSSAGRSHNTQSGPCNRPDGSNSLSLIRVDSGLVDDSVAAVSPLGSAASTDHTCNKRLRLFF